jgi:hypothetical protein
MSLKWPNKDPDEILDYTVDWTVRLYNATELAQYNAAIAADPSLAAADPSTVVMPTDTIRTSTFTLPAGIVASSTLNSTRIATVWITGGVELASYDVLNEIVTAGNRTMDQTIKLKIKSK